MSDGQQKTAWNHTSQILAWMVACQTGKKPKPDLFHPYAEPKQPGRPKVDFESLRREFVDS